ncbi:MAG TPA: hypothetical protein VJ729_07335 [Nitrososphaeraceae archaeon]|nr:hypothetical protein [Nitrososphaeraceae archaeon]
MLEEDAKYDKLRILALYSCRIHTEPMIQDNKDESSVKKPLFSRKEIVHLVRKFILAYIRGEITFDLATIPGTYKKGLEIDIMPIGEAQAFDETQKHFFQIPDTMLKCAGLINTNEEEYDACIDMLFKFMIFGRATKSIDGQFLMDWK